MKISRVSVGLLFAVVVALPSPAAVGPATPTSPTEVELVRGAAGITETGKLGGAAYRIDVPVDWNRSLVIFFHGYSERPTGFQASRGLNEVTRPMFERHYAVIQSGYSTVGWSAEHGVPESDDLRRYFLRKYGAVKDTVLASVSMGGALSMETMERDPKPYLGVLNLCGAVGPTFEAMQRRFAWRAAFDWYFPGVMPPLVPAPVGYEETKELRKKIDTAMAANPAGTAAMRGLTGLRSDADVAHLMSYITFVLADMAAKAGGNPFDNRNYLYAGTSATNTTSDNALNDGVKRYAAEERARQYLAHNYTPTGRLTKPMLALHTTYDPLIPGTTLALYDHMVEEAGFGQNLVQQYVRRDGHCAFTPEEVGAAFDELLTWGHAGVRPRPGLLR